MKVLPIRRVAVLGAGVMGAAIAGHLANVGIPSLLLDIVPRELTPDEQKRGLTLADKEVRNRFSNQGKAGLLKAKPEPLYTPANTDLIETGNFDDDFARIAACDWIIEAVVEKLDVKRDVLARVQEYRKPGSIVSSNTSGVSIEAMSDGRSHEFQQHFLGTHFFNPPRYMKLLEVIPTSRTLAEVVDGMFAFGESRLGKGTVIARDTPNFIANRIGTFGLLVTLEEMRNTTFGFDEVDVLTGPVLGRPKSATFRTLDIVGIDTFIHVAGNVFAAAKDEAERTVFAVPDDVQRMVQNGWLGEKSGQGFFKRERTASGEKEVLVLDLHSMTYRPRRKLAAASYETAKAATNLRDKMKALVYGQDQAGLFVWNVLKRVLTYSAGLVGNIADDIVAIDNAMKWGFNWELGPFETWDVLGLEKSVARMREEGLEIPEFVTSALRAGGSFYKQDIGRNMFFTGHAFDKVRQDERIIDLANLKDTGKVIFGNKGASMVDMGDGVACLEFHSPKQAIGSDMVNMMMKTAAEVEKNYDGLVIGSAAPNFCVGANLMLILMEAQDENWDEIDLAIRQFQNATMRMKYLTKPVVAAPYGMTLGGGAELCFGAAKVQAAAETYMGLVEVGVGLIPGGGGTKEVLLRALEQLPQGVALSSVPLVQKAFEVIAMAKVSTSAPQARELGYLRAGDGISVSRDHLLFDAKQAVLTMAKHFVPQTVKPIRVIGESGAALLKMGVFNMKKSGYISDHDELIGKKLAHVLTGGFVPEGTFVAEQHLLDLEREAFLSLCGEPKTQARMQNMLQRGKPLRN